jgi:hypothetical protein
MRDTAQNLRVRKPEVVLLALADLGGARKWVDTEDVAIRARELAPEAFSWRKYPEHIDLDGVRVALHDAGKASYGSLLEGSLRTGWSLTPAGVEWVKKNRRRLRTRLVRQRPSRRDEQRAETRKRALERGRIRRSSAWRLWTDGMVVPSAEARAVFRIDSETPPRDVHLKVQRITDLLGQDSSLGAFLASMARLVLAGEDRRIKAGRAQEGQRA